MDPIEVVTLEDGGQRPEDIAARLVAWLGEARESLDLALYDVRLPGPVGDEVAGAIRGARDRGVAVRIMFNQDEREEEPRPFEPPPPRTQPSLLEQLGVPIKAIPGWRDLMHHKYAVRDGGAVWTGSARRECARGSAPAAGPSSRTGSPSGWARRGAGSGSPRPCSRQGRSSAR
jgi:hypothetical protein